MPSVKETIILKPAYENLQGIGRFLFSDDYSVFDWGKMPDSIPNKGRALAVMAAYNFEQLSKLAVPSHFKGLISENKAAQVIDFPEGSKGSDIMEFNLAVRYDPTARRFVGENNQPRVEYDYSFFEKNRGQLNNFLVPLEIIFRNGLPKGSSVFKKLKKAEGDPVKTKAILDKLGLTEVPKEGDMLPKTIINYTTKLEESDRSLTEDEAYRISGLTEEQFAKVPGIALAVNDYVSKRAEQTGLAPHWDGKVEMVYFNQQLVLADVLGTLDEDRFGDRLSKEFLRQWYKKNQPDWEPACEEWKPTGEGWQERCPVKPVDLPKELTSLVSQMYMAACNQYVGRRIFAGVPELDEVVEKLKPHRD